MLEQVLYGMICKTQTLNRTSSSVTTWVNMFQFFKVKCTQLAKQLSTFKICFTESSILSFISLPVLKLCIFSILHFHFRLYFLSFHISSLLFQPLIPSIFYLFLSSHALVFCLECCHAINYLFLIIMFVSLRRSNIFYNISLSH